MIEINGLNKKFGNFTALNDLCLTVNTGELFGFVGANGAGKTTTMRICVGLETCDSGSVKIDGTEIIQKKGTRAFSEKVGFVPDFFGVYDNLTTNEYLKFFAGTYGIWGKTADTLVSGLLELVNLTDKKDFQVNSLSRGMKQRMSLARALVSNPDILFLDEPASGLDPKARHELKEILKNLTSMGKTIIISSHILPELIEMCTTIGIISHGHMRFVGSARDASMLSEGGEKLEIVVNCDPALVLPILLENPIIKHAEYTGNTIKALSEGEQSDYAALLKSLVMRDIPVVSYSKIMENVEDILLNIMEGDKND